MSKILKPTMTSLRKITGLILFNPKTDPMLKVLSDQASPEYYEKQSAVLLNEAQTLRNSGKKKEYVQTLIQIIRLLVLAAFYGGPNATKSTKAKGKTGS